MKTQDQPSALLRSGLAELGIEINEVQYQRLFAFLALLRKWNAVYNLTAIRSEHDMVRQHLLDALAVIPVVQERALLTGRWADIGSGAGLPGIPLAIVSSGIDITSIESVTKKAAFQRQVRIELGLTNFSVIEGRVETCPPGGFDVVISRAFADLRDFVRLAGHLLNPQGRLFAMKGAPTEDELNGLPNGWILGECVPLRVPGLDARRQLVVVRRSG